jgi:hypothetical protein
MTTRSALVGSILRSQDNRPTGPLLTWDDSEAIADRIISDGLITVTVEQGDATAPPDPDVPGAASEASVAAMADPRERYLRTVEQMGPDPELQARIDIARGQR